MVVLSGSLSNPSSGLTSAIRAYGKLELTGAAHPARAHAKQALRLTDPQRSRLAERYGEGATVYELADEFGVSRTSVSVHLKKAGVQLRFAALTDEQIQTAIELYGEGWSFAKIGERLSKDPSGIWRALKLAGIPRRDTHGRSR